MRKPVKQNKAEDILQASHKKLVVQQNYISTLNRGRATIDTKLNVSRSFLSPHFLEYLFFTSEIGTDCIEFLWTFFFGILSSLLRYVEFLRFKLKYNVE